MRETELSSLRWVHLSSSAAWMMINDGIGDDPGGNGIDDDSLVGGDDIGIDDDKIYSPIKHAGDWH